MIQLSGLMGGGVCPPLQIIDDLALVSIRFVSQQCEVGLGVQIHDAI